MYPSEQWPELDHLQVIHTKGDEKIALPIRAHFVDSENNLWIAVNCDDMLPKGGNQ